MSRITPDEREELLSQYERAFYQAGLPLLNERRTPLERSLTKGLWVILAIFMIEVLAVVDPDLPWQVNVGIVAGMFLVRALMIVLFNHVRGRKPFSIPDKIEVAEVAAFVFLPALLTLPFEDGVEKALVLVGLNLVCVGVVYAIYGYGVAAVIRWVLTHTLTTLKGSLTLMGRAVPLLLFFAFVLFLTTEIWEVFSSASAVKLTGALLLMLALIGLFMSVRLPREVAEFERETVYELDLDSQQKLNLGVVLFVAQGAQVLVVSALVAVFFAVMGTMILTPELISEWSGQNTHEIFSFNLFGEDFIVTKELLSVASAIAAFSGLYFTISTLTDATYREEFLDELRGDLKSVLRDRQDYLRLLQVS